MRRFSEALGLVRKLNDAAVNEDSTATTDAFFATHVLHALLSRAIERSALLFIKSVAV